MKKVVKGWIHIWKNGHLDVLPYGEFMIYPTRKTGFPPEDMVRVTVEVRALKEKYG